MSHLYRRNDIYWLAYYQNNKLFRESLKTKDKSSARYLQNKKDRELMQSNSAAPNQSNSCQLSLEEYLAYREHRGNKIANTKTEHEIKDFLEWASIKTFGQITDKRFQEYLNHKIKDEKLEHSTLDRYIASIKAWLNYCVKNHSIFFNPLVNVGKFRATLNPKRFLNAKEISALLKESKNPNNYIDHKPVLYSAIATGIYTGMRQAEIFNLEWPDVDFGRNQITIRNKEGFTTKSKKFRIVPLHANLRVILYPIRKAAGRCFDTTNNRRVFGRIRRKAGLADIGWHTLRHSFASHLVMQGVDLTTVSKLLGHASITTTLIYSHLSKDHVAGAVGRLDF